MPKQQGRGGMGNHKHGTSGAAGKSPKLRHAMKRDAERHEIKGRSKIETPYSSVTNLLKKKPRGV